MQKCDPRAIALCPDSKACGDHVFADGSDCDKYNQKFDHAKRRKSKQNAAAEIDSPLCAENENFIQTKHGYCFYALGSSPIIYNLYVHPQYRRHGYSKVLLGFVIGEIRKSGYKGEIHIQAQPREGSIGLEELTRYYKSMGLIVTQ